MSELFYKINKNSVFFRNYKKESIVVKNENKMIFVFTGIYSYMWRQLNKPVKMNDLFKLTILKYNIDKKNTKKTNKILEYFLDTMISENLIKKTSN